MSLYDRIDKVLNEQQLIEMANLTPKKTGLSVNIWSEHSGALVRREHNEPRLKIGQRDQYEVTVLIQPNPEIFDQYPKDMKKSDMRKIREAMDYVGRNYDLFLKHYNDTDDNFDDDDLRDELIKRGEYMK